MANLKSIVKVQRPIHTIDAHAGLLVYNAGRDKQVQQGATKKVLDAMGSEDKMFFHAIWHPATLTWEIGAPAPWQEW